MSIELHCPKCQKLIRAPDNAGGRRGKCPYCKNSVYIPMPSDEDEEIGLAPIDTEEERKAEELRRESIRFVSAVDHATDTRSLADAEPTTEQDPPALAVSADMVDVAVEVETYLLAMRDSKLDEAEAAAKRMSGVGPRAREHVERLLADQGSSSFEDIPPPVVKGFLKSLLNRLG